jgi:Kdo2-lipid IVA lauroyltransferase/acyltransferase
MQPALLLPRYWPTWIGVACLRMIEKLPYPVMMRVGSVMGRLVRRFPLRYAHIARRNMELCLPELPVAQREQLIKRHFECLGMSLCESAMTWWSDDERIRRLSRVEGLEHLEAALARGRGAILLTAHFTTLEIGARVMNAAMPINVLYRPPRNEVLAAIAHRARHGRARSAIRRDDIRAMVRALKGNEVVWYAPDQSYRRKGAQMVRFFGIPAATNTFTSRLARMTGAAVLLFSHERLPGAAGWRIAIHPALEDFPSDDASADTERYHHFIESEVRRIPEQYWWIHRRFKGLSASYPDYYARGTAPQSPAAI